MRGLLFSVYLLAILMSGMSQERERDFEVWLKASAETSLGDNLDIELEEQLRLDENASEIKNYFTDVSLKYQLTDHLDLRFATRFSRVNDNQGEIQGYENHLRFQTGVGTKHVWNRWRIRNRLVYQHKNELGLSEAEGDVSQQFVRIRSAWEYKIRNWSFDPIIRAEYFAPLNKAAAGTDESIRYGLGTNKDLSDWGKLALFFQSENSINSQEPETVHSLYFQFTYVF